jgi:hypothetical protein
VAEVAVAPFLLEQSGCHEHVSGLSKIQDRRLGVPSDNPIEVRKGLRLNVRRKVCPGIRSDHLSPLVNQRQPSRTEPFHQITRYRRGGGSLRRAGRK